MWQLLGLMLFCCLAGPLQGDPGKKSPGAIFVISQAAVNKYASGALVQNGLIQRQMLAIQFPDTPLKEQPEHWIKALHVVKVFVPTVSVELLENGYCLVCIKARLHLSAQFFFGKHFEWIDIIVDTEVTVQLKFVDFFAGVARLKYESCKSEFKIANIICPSHLTVNIVRPVIKSVIAVSLPHSMCQVAELVLDLARIEMLSTTNVLLSMGTTTTLQYHLGSLPAFGSSIFFVELNLIIRTGGRFITIPFSSIPTTMPSLNKNALSMGISQASLSTLINILVQIKVQEFMCTPELFSGATELTESIAALLSHQKCPKCPGKSPLKITLELVGTKRFILESKIALLTFSVQISILAKTSSGAFVGLFVLRANVKLTAQASVHDCKLIFSTKLTSIELILVSSEVGPIEISGLVKWIQLLLAETLVPQVNEHMSIGIPLPSVLHVNVGYPDIQILPGMLVLCV